MSEFTDFLGAGLEESLDILGTTEFSIDALRFRGDLGELGEQSYALVLGGRELTVRSALLCAIGQFGAAIPKAGTRLKIGGTMYMIASVAQDAVSVTFGLADPDAAR